MPHRGTGSVLSVHFLCVRVRSRRVASPEGFDTCVGAGRSRPLVLFNPIFRISFRRIGRKRVYMFGAAITAVWGFAYFGLLDTRVPHLAAIAIVLSLLPHDIMYGP